MKKKFRLRLFITLYIISLSIVLILDTMTLHKLKKRDTNQNKPHRETINKKTIEDTSECVISLIKQSLLQNKDIVIVQAKLESAHFSSRLFTQNNNIFGMKRVYNRPTTQINSQEEYGKYRSVEDAILDYHIWQRLYAHNLTEEQYFDTLSRIYATDKNYKSKLKQLLK